MFLFGGLNKFLDKFFILDRLKRTYGGGGIVPGEIVEHCCLFCIYLCSLTYSIYLDTIGVIFY